MLVSSAAFALAAGLAIGDPRESDVNGHHRAPDAKAEPETSAHPPRVEDVEQYRREAERGDAEAQTALGLAYETGQGVDRDYAEALVWYRRAAEQGHAEAQWQVCAAYEFGRGVERDRVEAKAWCLPAAEAGHVRAQAQLGTFYHQSIPPDNERAVKWNGLASQQGSALARLGMYYIYAKGGGGIRRDPVKALAYLDYAQYGRTFGGRIVVATVGKAPGERPSGGWDRDRLTRKMSKEQIAEAEQLLLQWTDGEELPDEPVIEYLSTE